LSKYSVKYTPRYIDDPVSGKQRILYAPYVDVLVTGLSTPKVVTCLIDSGADYNTFPYAFATEFLGISEDVLEKGPHLDLVGIGGFKSSEPAYGYRVGMQHPYFSFKTWVFFLKNQTVPLLGRNGFMDKFKSITFDEEHQKIVFDSN